MLGGRVGDKFTVRGEFAVLAGSWRVAEEEEKISAADDSFHTT
jgi:hypothetical protein